LEGFNQVYKNKTVLITGHTGFKGSWLSIWLKDLGANVVGYALDPKTSKDNFVVTKLSEKITDIRGDIRDFSKLRSVFDTHKPEFVFHLAAQPLVLQSYKLPKETFEVNVIGTINVLEAIRNSASAKVAIFATTDKVYQNQEKLEGYVETDPLGGYDPYSSSKASAEIAIQSWRNSYFNPEKYDVHHKSISSVRAGNVIGGGDWSEDRLIPDIMRSILTNETLVVRSPNSIRPWQHVLDVLNGYLVLGSKMYSRPSVFCEAWNFGPDDKSKVNVLKLVDDFTRNNPKFTRNIFNYENLHESGVLLLNSNKAFTELGWKNYLNYEETIRLTTDWYKSYANENVFELSLNQIRYFSQLIEGV
jgi:CDP-glucose 4,6-dehydratase